jgi:hypothetical protein
MTVYQPVCTCATEGIYGCAAHTYCDVTLTTMAFQPVEEVARLIAEGGAFTDQDAVRVARAYLEERT